MDALLSTPQYGGLEEPSASYLGTCVEDADLNFDLNAVLPEPTMEDVYQSDNTGSTTESDKTPPSTSVDPANWNDWRATEESSSESGQSGGQTSQFEVMSPPTASPFDECETDSDQVKSLKFEIRAVQKKRDLFQAQYWRLRAEVVWLLSALRHEIDRRRDAVIELMTLQFNQQIEDMNQRHLQDVVNHTRRQYGRLVDELQREKSRKEGDEVEKSSRKVLEDTVL